MKNKLIIASWNKISPSDVTKERLLSAIIEHNHAVSQNNILSRSSFLTSKKCLISTACCLALILTTVLIMTNLNKNTPIPDTSDNRQFSEITVDGTLDDPPVYENEPRIDLTVEELLNNKTYGPYYPKIVLPDYELTGNSPTIFGKEGNQVLQAKYYNSQFRDKMCISIVTKEWLQNQADVLGEENFRLNTVIYYNSLVNKSSHIYIDCGDFVISYSFTTRDIYQIPEFNDMVNSSDMISDFDVNLLQGGNLK